MCVHIFVQTYDLFHFECIVEIQTRLNASLMPASRAGSPLHLPLSRADISICPLLSERMPHLSFSLKRRSLSQNHPDFSVDVPSLLGLRNQAEVKDYRPFDQAQGIYRAARSIKFFAKILSKAYFVYKGDLKTPNITTPS